ncbi:mCG117712 [Mus musculus]|nr:mCG117712 [Mus musculus]
MATAVGNTWRVSREKELLGGISGDPEDHEQSPESHALIIRNVVYMQFQ